MKINLDDVSTWNYAEGGEILLGVTIHTKTGWSLYKPLNSEHTDWERVASSKDPREFDKILFSKSVSVAKPKTKTTTKEPAKNNKEETIPKQVKSKTTEKGKATKTSADSKKVKRSFL